MKMSNNLFFQTSTVADGNMSPKIGDTSGHQINQKLWLQSINLDYKDLCLMQCDHGDKITSVNRSNFIAGARPEAEVLITNEPGITLGLLTADCIPAIFYDPVNQALALAHLNRKTITHDLAIKTVISLRATFGSLASDLLVYFEPHIHARSYIFPLPLDEPIPQQLAPYIHEQAGVVEVDFTAAHIAQLHSAGVPAANIVVSNTDVATDTNYFSHNASKQDIKREPGRHLTIVRLQR